MHTAVKASGPPPAPDRQRVSPWAVVAKDCRDAPNEWFTAKGGHAPSVATYLRREWGLEVRTVDKRKVEGDDGREVERCTLWLRWTNESQAYADQLAETRGDEPSEPEDEGKDEPAEAADDTWATDDDDTDWEGAVANPNPADVTG